MLHIAPSGTRGQVAVLLGSVLLAELPVAQFPVSCQGAGQSSPPCSVSGGEASSGHFILPHRHMGEPYSSVSRLLADFIEGSVGGKGLKLLMEIGLLLTNNISFHKVSAFLTVETGMARGSWFSPAFR